MAKKHNSYPVEPSTLDMGFDEMDAASQQEKTAPSIVVWRMTVPNDEERRAYFREQPRQASPNFAV